MIHSVVFSYGLQHLTLTVLSFVLCGIIILLRRRIKHLSGRPDDLSAIQSMHTRLTPRVGGIAVFSALGVSILFAPFAISGKYNEFVLAAMVLFTVGLAEDLGCHMPPWRRLAAAGVSSLLVILFIDMSLPRVGIPLVDPLLQYPPVTVALTVLITAGLANGFNLIDGVNGLAALTAITAALALAFVSYQANYLSMMHLSMMLAAGVGGFFLLNYPFGLIFLGDAGAYTIGFVLSWFGIAILDKTPQASPWAILLILFWPVADTVLAIYRRTLSQAEVSAPDRLHVHQMVMRALEICVLSPKHRRLANSLTMLVLFPFVVTPPIAGVLLWDQNLHAFIAVVGFSVLFFVSYSISPALIHRFRRGKTAFKRE